MAVQRIQISPSRALAVAVVPEKSEGALQLDLRMHVLDGRRWVSTSSGVRLNASHIGDLVQALQMAGRDLQTVIPSQDC